MGGKRGCGSEIEDGKGGGFAAEVRWNPVVVPMIATRRIRQRKEEISISFLVNFDQNTDSTIMNLYIFC